MVTDMFMKRVIEVQVEEWKKQTQFENSVRENKFEKKIKKWCCLSID